MSSLEKLRIVTYNVNGVLNLIKRTKILLNLKKEKAHVALIQETLLGKHEHKKL